MEDKVSHQFATQHGIPKSVWEDNGSQLISYAIPRLILGSNGNINMICQFKSTSTFTVYSS